MKTVPITLITGYLGSGKTTLINYLLKNAGGYKMAVIVNDIGEVNIDADLIEKGGVVAGKDDNLVALQNGCICCTLKKDLIEQLASLVRSRKFDHILIEASGICEPIPIAQTITYLEDQFEQRGMPKYLKLDAVVSVTDALRLADEFGCGEALEHAERGEEDIENLVIQQLEFCDIVLLNKVDEVTPEQLDNIKAIIRKLQPHATIIDTNYCKVDLKQILDTGLFDFEKAVNSAGWMEEFDRTDNEEDADEHHHHHNHDDDDDDELDEINASDVGSYMADDRAKLRVQEGNDVSDRTKSGIVNVDTLGKFFNEGEKVTVAEIKRRVSYFPKNVTYIKVLARGKLDKPLIVVADDFSLEAVKMIVLTGGRAIRTKRK